MAVTISDPLSQTLFLISVIISEDMIGSSNPYDRHYSTEEESGPGRWPETNDRRTTVKEVNQHSVAIRYVEILPVNKTFAIRSNKP